MKKVYLGMVSAVALVGLSACVTGDKDILTVKVDNKIDLVKDSDGEHLNLNVAMENTSKKKKIIIDDINVVDDSEKEYEPEMTSEDGEFDAKNIQAGKSEKGALQFDLDKDKEYTFVVEYKTDEKSDKTETTEVTFKTDDINNLEDEFKKPLNAYIDAVVFGKELSEEDAKLLANDMEQEKTDFDAGFTMALDYTFDEYDLTDKEQEDILDAVKEVYGKTGGLDIETEEVNPEEGTFKVAIPSLDLTDVDELATYIASLAIKYRDESAVTGPKKMQEDLAKKMPELIKKADVKSMETMDMNLKVVYQPEDKNYLLQF